MTMTLTNLLTNRTWRLSPVAAGVGQNAKFNFGGYAPGDYTVVNEGVLAVDVTLWGRTYTVLPNTNWTFMAHSELNNMGVHARQVRLPGQQVFPGVVSSTTLQEWSPEAATYSQEPEALKAVEAEEKKEAEAAAKAEREREKDERRQTEEHEIPPTPAPAPARASGQVSAPPKTERGEENSRGKERGDEPTRAGPPTPRRK